MLQAALACATERGLDAVSIEGVRARCGASVGSIYHHFGSREGIVAALYVALFQRQTAAIAAALRHAHTPQQGVQALVHGYLDWVVAYPDQARFMFQARGLATQSVRKADLNVSAQQRNQALVDWFAPHQALGTVLPLPCELLPSLVMGPVQSYCRAWLSAEASGTGSLPPPTRFRDELAQAAWQAVAGPGHARQ
ncbi:TetR family transcriptional regulator [Hydrogenophaga crassostreae]|uniref:TetR family transcriptional regulator n=1 Tax=Hydrogenophaga crassostreae TaxID=1763535 RepID=A0A1D8P1S7_9BURK|nr:TetR family transcriptional regulator [Hydrogenophaga crassostreae]